MINSRSAIKNERVTFMYYNMDTNSLVAKTDEELNAYYERTYKEAVEAGDIDPKECSLEDWINDDAAVQYKPVGEILWSESSGTHYRIDDYRAWNNDYVATSVIVNDDGEVEEELSSTILTAREVDHLINY